MADVMLFTPTTTVQAVFSTIPNASGIFIKHKTGCVGCFLARFCTLGEVADTYELDLQSLLNDFQQEIR